MHLVFLNQYYPPDEAPTGRVLESVVRRLVADGHRVTVICAAGGGYAAGDHPSADAGEAGPAGHADGARILRVGATAFGRNSFVGKLLDYTSFYLATTWKLLTMRPRPDRVVALTTPPYLSLLARGVSWLRGGDHAHWVMDLYPDVMVAHGMIKEKGAAHRLLKAVAAWGWGGRRNAGVLSLGPDMRERVAERVGGTRCEWVALWPTARERRRAPDELENRAAEMRRSRGWAPDELVLMYSGNMGLGHRFGEFLEASQRTGRGVRWAFFGGGRRAGEIEEFIRRHPDASLERHGYVSHRELSVHLKSADVHLASLDPSWDGTMVPSKLQGIVASARPVLFVGSATCAIGRWIAESGAGWVVPPGDPESLLAALDEARDPEARRVRARAAAAMARESFDEATNASRVAEFFTGKPPPGA